MNQQKHKDPLSPLHVGVVEKNQGEYWDKINQGFTDAGEIFNVEFEITSPVYENVDEQIELLESQIRNKPDGIIFVASDRFAFNPVVKKAIESGIPVVTIDLDAPESGRYLYVGMKSPVELGREAGNLMAQHAKNKGKIAVQTGSISAQGAIGKLEGFREVVEGLGFELVEVLNDGEVLDDATLNAKTCLEKYQDLVGFYGIYGYHPYIQAEAVLKEGKQENLTIIGFDMLPKTIKYLESGTVTASIWIQEYFFGYYATAAIYNILKMGDDRALRLFGMDELNYENNSIILPTMVWSADNIALFKKRFPMYS